MAPEAIGGFFESQHFLRRTQKLTKKKGAKEAFAEAKKQFYVQES